MPRLPFRNIIEEPRFCKAKKELDIIERDIDKAISGVTWVLSRAPNHGERIPDTEIWAITTQPCFGVPALILYYRFNSSSVWLLHIGCAEEGEDN